MIFLFSDGFGDQLNAEEQEFGHARLGRVLKQNSDLPTQTLVDVFFAELDQYMDGTPITDDQTAIVMRVS